ncbi:hypothetical protein WJX73_004023 [Symbiochloris irregularis]|uniref:Methyltransferase type 11 domain-containing protein n=1 Tax=Symbiochloris irregularis TaxID=706552 RepID=A0AAW1PEI2_9CHLO
MATSAGTDLHAGAKAFNLQANAYELGRPSYPDEAVQAALQDTGLLNKNEASVLDLAAGTGKFTRLLAAQPSLHVSAIEPAKGMREAFEQNQPSWNLPRPVTIKDGSATSLPFGDGTFDAVFAAQAFHWFASEAALREIHRILKRSGHIVLIWNREDDQIPWQKELLQLFEPHSQHIPQYWQGKWKDAFKNDFARNSLGVKDVEAQSKFFRDSMRMTPDTLWARVLSKSYISAMDAQQQAKIKQSVDGILQEHQPSKHGTGSQDDEFEVVVKTELFICQRKD